MMHLIAKTIKNNIKTKKNLRKTKNIIQKSRKSQKPTKRVSKPKLNTKVKRLINKKPKITIRKKNPLWPKQDESTSTFEDLLNEGYDMVTFVAHPNACPKCKAMNGRTWRLQEFLDTTEYNAPIFSHSHCNAASPVKVWDSNNILPDVYVDYTGNIS